MMPMMLEAALRSLLVAAAVAAGLRLLRVRNVLAQKSAWTLVLAAALAMPLLQPIAARWQLLPAIATFTLPGHPFSRFVSRLAAFRHHPAASVAEPRALAATPLAAKQEPAQIFTYTSSGTSSADIASPVEDSGYLLSRTDSRTYQGTPGSTSPAIAASARPALSLAELAWLAYLAVAVTLLFRLFVGLASALLIWMGAVPVTLRDRAGLAEGLSLRASREVASPVTVGSAVILPADFADWEIDKLRIVLAHERSHIRQCDFYLQFLAGLYAAIVWFSPLGWWLKRTLSDLAETISDRAGLEQAADSSSYAQILLEFAAAPRLTLTGVAMARPGSLSRRIERLLNESSFSQAFAGGRARLCVAVLLVPA
ncbi:MAG: M56 family metallopeptidase, partial [Terracidiphilus sp.]